MATEVKGLLMFAVLNAGVSCLFCRWVHFSQLPYLPEIDALKEDLSIINQCFHHLHKVNSKETYVEAYKYAFSRKGMPCDDTYPHSDEL
jgi:hypothetical protein